MQKGLKPSALVRFNNDFNIKNFGTNFDEKNGAFIDTASIIKCLDLVISVDTSIAHFAGALTCPTWVLLQSSADWRWQLNRTDTPWYRTMKLFRQPKQGDWNTVVQEIKIEIEKLVNKKGDDE